MRALKRLVMAAALVFAAACEPDDATNPSDGRSGNIGISADYSTISGTSCSPTDVHDGIVAFMTGVTPNESSAANGKWNDVKTAVEAGDYDAARAAAEVLIGFLNLQYDQAVRKGTITPSSTVPGTTLTYSQYLDTLEAAINCFVGQFDVPQDNQDRHLGLPGEGGVTFPAGFCTPAKGCPGIQVTLTPIPVPLGGWCNDYDNATKQFFVLNGCTPPPLNTPLDQSGISYLSIETDPRICSPGETPTGDPPSCYPIPEIGGKKLFPTVALCYDAPPEEITGYRVGHQHRTGFSVLKFADIDTDLEAIIDCDEVYKDIWDILNPPATPASASVLGLLLEKAQGFFLPEMLNAAMASAFGGAGGSAEEFSPFGAVSASLGGAGGSAEEFAPPAISTSATNPNTAPDISGTTITQQAGAANWTGIALPSVVVQTQGLDGVVDPIQGVLVTFSVEPTLQYPGQVSNATVCDPGSLPATGYPKYTGGSPATYQALTDEFGRAQLGCLSFANKAGYAKLRATFDASTAFSDNNEVKVFVTDCSASPEECDETSAKWLLVTTAGPATQLVKIQPGSTLNGNFTQDVLGTLDATYDPTVEARDTYGNSVAGAVIEWNANSNEIAGPSPACANLVTGTTTSLQDVVCTTSSTAASLGQSSITKWVLGPGENTLTARLRGGPSTAAVEFLADGRFTKSIVNACAPGTGQKDAVFSNGLSGPYYFTIKNAPGLLSVSLFLSTNGAPGSGEKYVVFVSTKKGSTTYTARNSLPSSPNVNKERALAFLFSGASGVSGDLTFRVDAKLQRADGSLTDLPSNVTINANAGQCLPGKTCTAVVAPQASFPLDDLSAATCNTEERKNGDSRFVRYAFPAWLAAPVAPSP